MALLQGTLYFMAIDLLSADDEVVHELRHDLESFFWLLVWLVLRHTTHSLGKRACEILFNRENEIECRMQKGGFLSDAQEPLVVALNQPLTNLISEFREACKSNIAGQNRPSDPLTHKKVLKLFDDALAREGWPTQKDHARAYKIPNDDKELRRQGTRAESNIDSNCIGSGTARSNPPSGQRESSKVLLSGSRRARRPANATGSGSGAQVASGSRSRKRSREAREMTDVLDDAGSDGERTKRTKTNSEHNAAEASGRRKQPKARRGRK